jgi:hypothetical protein
MNVSSTGCGCSPAAEARETKAQTEAEATKGDKQAVQKLAQQKAAEEAKGVSDSPFTAAGRLDTTA